MARLANVALSLELLQEIITEGWQVGLDCETESITCTLGLPRGAKLRNISHGVKYNEVMLLFEHESFRDVAPHGAIYSIEVEYLRKYRPLHTHDNLSPEEAQDG